jgi:hypothetical protein
VRRALPFLSYGKLRGSYGTTGNDGIGDYQYLDRYEFQTQPYQGAKGLKVVTIYNQDFAWELTRKTELGLETGFFKDRILFNASYYHNISGNQLLVSPLPAMTGGTSVMGNLSADIRNTGLELTFTTKNIQTRHFQWSTDFNITVAHNKLLSYPKNIPIYAKEGRALSTKDLYKFISVDPITGIYLFANLENKPVAATDASVAYNATSKDLAPTYFGGCQNSFRYKEFRLDIFFQYVKQQGQNGEFDPAWIPGTMRNQPVAALTRWRKEGDAANLQKTNQNFQLFRDYNTWLSSDRAYSNASFIRCKNVAFSWQLPENWKRKMHVNNSRFYIQGQNLFTITRYRGWDPETQSATVIPPLRVLTAGIQLTL